MRLQKHLLEFSRKKDLGTLVAIDIDETIFNTFAEIKVMKNGKEVKSLNNQEFNTYELQDGESFDFHEFRDAKFFNKTSIPIPKTVARIKRMLSSVSHDRPDIILLTARADFDDKETFLNTFRKHNLPIDDMYVERVGNMKSGTTDERKKKTLMKYLMTGKYTDVKLLDDDKRNVQTFAKMGKTLPQKVYDRVRQVNGLPKDEMVNIHFFPMLVDGSGNIKRVN
jgi:hypothetical protein